MESGSPPSLSIRSLQLTDFEGRPDSPIDTILRDDDIDTPLERNRLGYAWPPIDPFLSPSADTLVDAESELRLPASAAVGLDAMLPSLPESVHGGLPIPRELPSRLPLVVELALFLAIDLKSQLLSRKKLLQLQGNQSTICDPIYEGLIHNLM